MNQPSTAFYNFSSDRWTRELLPARIGGKGGSFPAQHRRIGPRRFAPLATLCRKGTSPPTRAACCGPSGDPAGDPDRGRRPSGRRPGARDNEKGRRACPRSAAVPDTGLILRASIDARGPRKKSVRENGSANAGFSPKQAATERRRASGCPSDTPPLASSDDREKEHRGRKGAARGRRATRPRTHAKMTGELSSVYSSGQSKIELAKFSLAFRHCVAVGARTVNLASTLRHRATPVVYLILRIKKKWGVLNVCCRRYGRAQ